MGRIALEHVPAAVVKLRSMSMAQKTALIDEIHITQPNLLASRIVQAQLGADERAVELLLNLLLTCYIAMRESGYEWPLISEVQQERELKRTVAAVLFSEHMADPKVANAARTQYITGHPEQPLLALIIAECNEWMRGLAKSAAEKASDKYVMLASVNLVNCIAHSTAQRRAASR